MAVVMWKGCSRNSFSAAARVVTFFLDWNIHGFLIGLSCLRARNGAGVKVWMWARQVDGSSCSEKWSRGAARNALGATRENMLEGFSGCLTIINLCYGHFVGCGEFETTEGAIG